MQYQDIHIKAICTDSNLKIRISNYPRANGAKRRYRHKPGARVLIPPGYFSTLEKSMGSLKFIKLCGRIAIVHGFMGSSYPLIAAYPFTAAYPLTAA